MGFNRRGALMPKRKPDELIEYRISLQDKERELLDQVSTAYSVNKIATPLVNLLSDASAMALVVAFLYSIFNKSGDMEGSDPYFSRQLLVALKISSRTSLFGI